MKITVNGQDYFFDYETYKKEQLFLKYKADLLWLVVWNPSKWLVDKANQYLLLTHEEYRQFIEI